MCSSYTYKHILFIFITHHALLQGKHMHLISIHHTYTEIRGARLSLTDVAACLDAAASEARYESVNPPPDTPHPTPNQDFTKEIGKEIPSLRSGKGFSSATERLDICKGCPEYRKGLCEVCGCNMSIKTKLPFARCPMGKW